MTRVMANQIRAHAKADGDRPAGQWLRVQVEKLLEQLNGKAKL